LIYLNHDTVRDPSGNIYKDPVCNRAGKREYRAIPWDHAVAGIKSESDVSYLWPPFCCERID
jgi:hypothetical protein